MLAAFQSGSVDVLDRAIRLQDDPEVDAVKALAWTQRSSVRLGFTLWEQRVVGQPDTIRLFERS